MQKKVISLALSAFFVIFVGSFRCTAGIGISLFLVALLSILTLRLRKCGAWERGFDTINTLCAFGLSVLPTFTTNYLTLFVSGAILTAYLGLILLRCAAPQYKLSVGTLSGIFGAFLIRAAVGIVEAVKESFDRRFLRIPKRVLFGLGF